MTQKRKTYSTHKQHRQLLSEKDVLFWTWRTDLKTETESELVAQQPEALQTENHSTRILRSETDSKCRLRQQRDETVDHITSISAWPMLAKQ